MTTSPFTLDNLKVILQQGAGVEELVDLDGDILDTDFENLGYDSLALLETGSRIERGYGIVLDDTVVAEAKTPRTLLAAVNQQLIDAPA